MKTTMVNGVECVLLHYRDPLVEAIPGANEGAVHGECSLCPAAGTEDCQARNGTVNCQGGYLVPTVWIPILKLRSTT
jgi:hypothetical protein